MCDPWGSGAGEPVGYAIAKTVTALVPARLLPCSKAGYRSPAGMRPVTGAVPVHRQAVTVHRYDGTAGDGAYGLTVLVLMGLMGLMGLRAVKDPVLYT